MAAQVIADGSLLTLTQEVFPYHARAAIRTGLQLLMYEGGSYGAAQGALMDIEEIQFEQEPQKVVQSSEF